MVGSSAERVLLFVISQAVLRWGKNPMPCSTGRVSGPFGERCSQNLYVWTEIKLSSALHSALKSLNSLNSLHGSSVSCMFTTASERNPLCSLQLRLAHVTREKVSGVRHSCSALKQVHNQPPGEAVVQQRREEGGNVLLNTFTSVCFAMEDEKWLNYQ